MLHIYEVKWNGSDKAIFYQKILERAGLSEVNQYQEVFCVDVQVFQSYSGIPRINSATGLEVEEATFVTWFLWHGIEAERMNIFGGSRRWKTRQKCTGIDYVGAILMDLKH